MKIELSGWPMLLTTIFVVLKVVGKIDWSWWWVLSPLWISLLVGLAVLLVILAVIAVGAILSSR